MSSEPKHDPIEDDPRYRAILDKTERKARKECKDRKGQMGYCHAFWGAKQRILAEKYHIEWKSPAELNPYWKFD
jgi:hypothetical protein